MTSLSYPVHVKFKIFELEKICHMIHQSTSKGLQSSFLALFSGFRSVVSVKLAIFKKIIIGKIHGNRHGILITSSWRHRICSEDEKILRLGSFWFFKFSQILARGVFGCADSKYQLGISDFGHWRALARKRKNQNISVRHTKLDWPHIEFYHN